MATEMSSRDRLLAAIRHEEPDRVPVSPRIWAWLRERYDRVDLSVYLRLQEEFGHDILDCVGNPSPSYAFAWPGTYRLDGVEVEVREELDGDVRVVERTFRTPAGPLHDRSRHAPPGGIYGISPNPTVEEALVKDRDDLQRLRYLFPPLPTSHQAYHQAVETLGDRGLVELYLHGPLDCRGGDARGMQALMIDYHADRELFDGVVSIYHERMMAETRRALEDGVTIIFGSWFYESFSAGWSPTIWRDAFLPRLREQVELVHAAGALYHYYDDGVLAALLPLLAEVGIDILSTCTPPPVGDFDLAAAKRDYGDRLCFKGYIDLLYTMLKGTPEMVREAVREALEVGKPGGGFILGSSDSFRDGTPLENVRAYYAAAREFG